MVLVFVNMEEGEIVGDNSDDEVNPDDHLDSWSRVSQNQNKNLLSRRSPKLTALKLPVDSHTDPGISPE